MVPVIVTTCPPELKELESKNTLSPPVGIQLHVVPPLEADQWEESLQLPVPPIQYRLAADTLFNNVKIVRVNNNEISFM